MSAILELLDALVTRNDRVILNIDRLVIEEGKVLAVVGPNGAGKSTLLLVLAQLLQPDNGTLYFRGRPLRKRDRLAYRRQIGLVFQVPLLLNATVIDNVKTGLDFRHLPKDERGLLAEKWLNRFGIAHLQKQKAPQLSGGEAQRVSLARAFSLNPAVLFLDEPFSALDTPTRSRLLDDFQSLLAETRNTTILVTHDMNEALLLADQMAVLLSGELRQIGPPDQVFAAPADPEVAAFLGLDTTVAGEVTKIGNGHIVVSVNDQKVEAVAEVDLGRQVMVCLRPEDVTLWSGTNLPASSARNQLSGTISKIQPRGSLIHVVVDCGFPVSSLITRASAREMALEPGDQVTVTFKASAVHLIPR